MWSTQHLRPQLMVDESQSMVSNNVYTSLSSQQICSVQPEQINSVMTGASPEGSGQSSLFLQIQHYMCTQLSSVAVVPYLTYVYSHMVQGETLSLQSTVYQLAYGVRYYVFYKLRQWPVACLIAVSYYLPIRYIAQSCELHLCNHVHTSLSCTTRSQHFLVMWPTAQPKTALMISFVVHESTIYMALQIT